MNPGMGHEGRVALQAWYAEEGRELPWRLTKDPYAIWVSEVMCQQTQVAKVIPFWRTWMLRFPTIEACAAASEHDALHVWQGLGYYRRCKQLVHGAQYVVANGWPESAAAWLKVPGVGRYTAAAIASITLEEAVAVVDGNVKRVFARLEANDAQGADLESQCWDWAQKQIEQIEGSHGDWNQAVMELGATVCTPRSPQCGKCPLTGYCEAFKLGLQKELPSSGPSPELIEMHHTVLVPVCEGLYGIRPIPAGQWWQGMWEFPGTLSTLAMTSDKEHLGTLKYRVTRHAVTLEVHLDRCDDMDEDLTWVPADDLGLYPMPSPQRRVLDLVVAHYSQPRLEL